MKPEKAKNEKQVSSRPVLTVDHQSGSITVPGSHGHELSAAFEDNSHAIIDVDPASIITDSIDCIDNSIDDVLSQNYNNWGNEEQSENNISIKPIHDSDFSSVNDHLIITHDNQEHFNTLERSKVPTDEASPLGF